VRQADSNAAARTAAPARVIPLTTAETEAARELQICNACRYCEGYCAVFPAMTRRLEFVKADINYLANLCHNCGACYHACQYAPPHEFAVNMPRAMAVVRGQTYAEFAWPAALGALYRRNGLTVALALAAGLTLLIALACAVSAPSAPPARGGDFYAVLPHNVMAALFGIVFLAAVVALGFGVARFWRDIAPGSPCAPAVAEATMDVLGLKYLGGGHGDGCNETDDRFTVTRRWFHHATFYGFALCFAATVIATMDHYLFGLHAPYPGGSAPVVLGVLGGIGLLVGPTGLLWLNLRRDPQAGDPSQRPMDRAFIALLLLTSGSGLALLVCRATAQMPTLLVTHLGIVLALFATLPYGKFAHGIFRSAALLKWTIEKRRPSRLRTGDD
jgi:citrate/tricarballylate utilization protein